MIIDPVCGMHVDPEGAPATFTWREHTFYFCCDECMQKFKANPWQFVQNAIDQNPQGYGDLKKAA
jgi:Cu+-exporting ATPase